MRPLITFTAALLLSGLTLPAAALTPFDRHGPSSGVVDQLARGGGRGGGAAARPQTGFASAGSGLNRGTSRPSGGWSSRVPADRATPSLNRDVNRNVNRNITRHWGGNVNLAGVNLVPGWARPGWGVARPWPHGWYGGWARPAWGWWGARAAAWGITTLATASVINAAVNSAVQNQVSYIVVPETDLQLLYGTVQPSGSHGVTFLVTDNGNSYRLSADCEAGTLNGNVPTSAAEAELVNAACQVAFGAA
ncbi:MAG: hypothetical protein RLZZ336_1051 [Cyanobacteriota bacterium]